MLTTFAETFNSTYNYTSSSSGGSSLLSGTVGVVIGLVALVLSIVMVVCLWKIFVKAGEAGWKSLIPFYNTWILAELAGKPGWWSLVSLLSVIPVVGYIAVLVVYVILYLELAKAFGKSTGFAVLMILVPVVALPILAFGDAKYIGKKYGTNGGATPSTPVAPVGPAAPTITPTTPAAV